MKKKIKLIRLERDSRFNLISELIWDDPSKENELPLQVLEQKVIKISKLLFEEGLIDADLFLDIKKIDLGDGAKGPLLMRDIFYDSLQFIQNENRIKEWDEREVINSFKGGEIDEEYLQDYFDLEYYKERDRYNEILNPQYLEKVAFPYDEIYIVTFYECLENPNPRVLHIKHLLGISIKDIAEMFYHHLPDYGYHRYYQGLKYKGDYKKVPLYELSLGS